MFLLWLLVQSCKMCILDNVLASDLLCPLINSKYKRVSYLLKKKIIIQNQKILSVSKFIILQKRIRVWLSARKRSAVVDDIDEFEDCKLFPWHNYTLSFWIFALNSDDRVQTRGCWRLVFNKWNGKINKLRHKTSTKSRKCQPIWAHSLCLWWKTEKVQNYFVILTFTVAN